MELHRESAEQAKAREKEKLLSYGLKTSSETAHEAAPSSQVSKPSQNLQAALTCYASNPYAAFGPFAFIMQLIDAVSLNNHGVHVGLDCCSTPLHSPQHTVPCPRCGRLCPARDPSGLSVRCCHCDLTAARDDPTCPFTVIVHGPGFRIHGDTIKYRGGAVKVVGHCTLRVDRSNNIYVKGGSEIAVRRCNDIHVVGGGKVSVHRCNNVRVEGGGSVSVHRCNGVRVDGAGDVTVGRCARAQVDSSGHVRIHRCDGDARIDRSGDARIHRCGSARITKSGNARIHRCDSAVVEGGGDVHVHRCASARLEGCGTVRIHRCDTATVGNCRDVQIHRGQILP